jgi:hypothetical protein
MGPPPQYKLTSTCQNAITPKWPLDMLRSEHGISHSPRPSSLSEDGLHTPWSSTLVNFVNPPFVRAKEWLLKAVEEAHQYKHSIVVCAWCATTSKETKRNTSRQ